MKKYILILLIIGQLSNAQYNLFARQNFNYKTVSTGTNTEIGGVASTISTPALLATKLGIDVSRITNFSIVGSDIKCRITGSYGIPSNAFLSNTSIIYYFDYEGLVTSMGYEVFKSSTITKSYFPNVTSTDTSVWTSGGGPLMDYVYIPRCTNLGGTVGDNACFVFYYRVKTIYADPSLATINGGAPDGDIAYAISQGATVRYVTNFTAPNPVTTLSAGTVYNTAIQLNFTPPSSTNAIDYYECYVNGVLQSQKVTASGQYITGLTPSTSYNITLKAVDVFYNKSTVSNSVSATTTNRSAVDSDAIAYITASSNTIYQDIIDDLFASLKSNSLYTKIQAFYPFLGTTTTQHKWNGKNPLDTNAAFRLTFSGTATFSDSGYTPNGSTGYANTNFIPSVNQNVNSNGLTIVSGTNNAVVNSDVVDIGSFNSGTQKSYVIVKNNNSTYARIVGLNSTNISLTGTNESRGIFTGTKQSATVTDFFINGSQVGTVSGGGTLPTVSCYIGAMNLGGSPYGYSNQRIQFTAIHEGLSDAEVATLHTIIDTFEAALGRKTW